MKSEESAYATPYRPSISTRLRHLLAHCRERLYEAVIDFCLERHPAAKGSNIVAHAKAELRLSGWYDKDAFYGDLVPKAVLRQVRLFAIEGHSGMSAPLVARLVQQATMFRPLSPLTGGDDEWQEVADGVFQNRRFSSVFKDGDGNAYNIDGRVFDDGIGTFTNHDSRTPVEFPWTWQEPEVVKVEPEQ